MLTKLVNGKRITLSATEEAAVRADWATSAAKVPPHPIDQRYASDPAYAALVREIAALNGETAETVLARMKG
jgi:hypothetical protein